MNLTRQRQLIYAAAMGLVALSGVGVIWAFSSIESDAGLARQVGAQPKLKVADIQSQQPTFGRDVNFDAPMLKSLIDPTPQPPKRPPRKPTPPPKKTIAPISSPRLNWTLVGTIIDGKDSVAILSDADGKTDVRRVGETVELLPAGAVVQRIESDQVSLKLSRGESTLKLDQSFKSMVGRNARPGRGASR